MLTYGNRKREPEQTISVQITDLTTGADIEELIAEQSRYEFVSYTQTGFVPSYWRVVLHDLVTDQQTSFIVLESDYVTYDPNIGTIFKQPEQAWERMYNQQYTNEFLEFDN